MLTVPPKPKRPRIHKRGARARCDAFNKTRFEKPSPSGIARLRSPRCRAWAMPNGRCRLHGGLSTGPKTAEGKAAVVTALVAGRRTWIEKLHCEGARAPCGRKAGAGWITPTMVERAAAEARRIGGEIIGDADRRRVLLLLRSAKGDAKAEDKARAAIALAKRRELERLCEEASRAVRAWQARRAESRSLAEGGGARD